MWSACTISGCSCQRTSRWDRSFTIAMSLAWHWSAWSGNSETRRASRSSLPRWQSSSKSASDDAPDNGRVRSETQGPGQSGTRGAEALRDWGRALGIFVLCTAAALALRTHVAATNLAMIYLLGVVAVATRCSLRVSIAACLLSVAAFDFFCVPPYLTLRVTDYEYLITFAGMLAVALVISMQTARIRLHAADAGVREARTGTLYRLSRHLAHHTR